MMREQGVGALLVTTADGHGELVGIFTERDLLKKISLIHETETWMKPIRHVMTKDPSTVSLDTIHKAPHIMLELGVRHVPVVEVIDGRPRAIGVISMRDCFQFLYDNGVVDSVFEWGTEDFAAKRGLKPLGLVAANNAVAKIIDSSFGDQIKVERLDPAHKIRPGLEEEDLRPFAALLVDIDGEDTRDWVQLLKRLHNPKLPPVVVCYDPHKHPGMQATVLKKLKGVQRFHVFTKPIHLMEFVLLLKTLLSKAPPQKR